MSTKINPKKYTPLVKQEIAEKLLNKSFPEAVNILLNYYLLLPFELIDFVDDLLVVNKHSGCQSREQFFIESALWRIKYLDNSIENLEFSKEIIEKTRSAIEDMDMPFKDAHDFLLEPMNRLHEHHEEWKQQKRETEEFH